MRAIVLGCMLSLVVAGCADQVEEETVPGADTTVATVPAAEAATGGMLDPNTASGQEMTAIPNVDGLLAAEIIAGRPYQNMLGVDRLLAVKLNEEQRDLVYTRLWLPVDVNKASAPEIELIPGVGERMRGEFEEYRPFQSVEHFRTEIGKYADAAEVDRLLRYVVIR